MKIQLRLQAGQLDCGKQSVALRHHRAALFLAGVIAASQQGRPFAKTDFLSAWAAVDPQTIPDRTAIRRIVMAVREALDAVLPNGAARLIVPARGLTTGPWRLLVLPNEQWTVESSPTTLGDVEPSFTAQDDPLAWCAAANGLATADGMLNEGQYDDAICLLQDQLRSNLSDSAWCLWMLRLVRAQRRIGRHAQAQDNVRSLETRASGLAWRMRAYVLSKVALLTARSAFDDLPLHTSLGVNFEAVREVVDTAPNVNLQWEWCNLRALAYRRQIERHLQAKSQPEIVNKLVIATVNTFGAAYFWACLAKDSYHGQAIACNFAYNLHWLHKKQLYDGLQASIAWFRLAHTLVDRFDLPQDSAWDFLMLGDIYLGSAQARAVVDADALSWPEQSNPAHEVFYLRGLELARRYGDVRQVIMALNQHAGFLQLNGLVAGKHKSRKERDALMVTNLAVAEDMVKDGFEAL